MSARRSPDVDKPCIDEQLLSALLFDAGFKPVEKRIFGARYRPHWHIQHYEEKTILYHPVRRSPNSLMRKKILSNL